MKQSAYMSDWMQEYSDRTRRNSYLSPQYVKFSAMGNKLHRAVDVSMIEDQMQWRTASHRLKIGVGAVKEHHMKDFLIDIDTS
jgi:hypothetical protein